MGRAQQAARDAEEDLRVISVYDRAAQKAWSDVQESLASFKNADTVIRKHLPFQNPQLRPFWKFCGDLAAKLEDEPSRANEPHYVQLREYCENLQAGFEGERPPPERGFRMYGQLPQEEPR